MQFGSVDENGDLYRYALDAPNDSLRFQNPLNLLGQVTTGILEHTLLFGYDYFHEESGNTRDGICCPDFSINIFNHTFLTEQPAFGPADGFQLSMPE